MPFDPETKARMFIRSARICCLCYKQCGTNMEAAHIVDESRGGSNDDENGIPLCLDCHQEVGAYDPKHPRGNKFSPKELKARRDKLYELVDSGFLQAQVVTNRLKTASRESIPEEIRFPDKYNPNKDVKEILKLATRSDRPYESIPLKLELLGEQDQAYVIDSFVGEYDQNANLKILLLVAASKQFAGRAQVILEQVLRRVTISSDTEIKRVFMSCVAPDVMMKSDEGLRLTFFTDVISTLEMEQFDDVNKLAPTIVNIQDCLPDDLVPRYLRAMMQLATSKAWYAKPAARKCLLDLPDKLIKPALDLIDDESFFWRRDEFFQQFLGRYRKYWPRKKAERFDDFMNLDSTEYYLKWHSGARGKGL